MLFLYRLTSYIALPFLIAYIVFRYIRNDEYRVRLKERFGFVPAKIEGKTSFWIHTVSVGEVIAVESLIKDLLDEFPSIEFLVTTTTSTGSMEVRKRLGSRVSHFYVPYDLRGCIRRFMRRRKPRVLILVETELWPNTIDMVNASNVPIYLINARLSEKSARNYARVRGLSNKMMSMLKGIACQYEDTAERFHTLGVSKDRLFVTGSIKFDVHISPSQEHQTKQINAAWCFDRHPWVAASTHDPEERVVLDTYRQLLGDFPNQFLILVPRHPERAARLVELCLSFGFTASLFSQPPQKVQILVVDQVGLLLPVLGLARAVFIGGSLQGTGGHNPIEPAVQRVPMLMGPDRHNFDEICRRFEDAGALEMVHNAAQLSTSLANLLNDEENARKRTSAALNVVYANRGAQERLKKLLIEWLARAKDPIDSQF